MDGGIASSSPESLAGILKTIFLFLENQNFTETCGTLVRESQNKHIPHIREAPARLVVLRPSLTETVRIAHADPKRPDTDGQVQADFPLPFTDRSCVLEGSVYAMPEIHPSSKYVSLFITDRNDGKAPECGKLRIASAPNLGINECHSLNEHVRESPTVRNDLIKRPTEEDLTKVQNEDDLVKRTTDDDLFEKPTEEDSIVKETEDGLFEKPTEEDLIVEATEDGLFETTNEDDLFEKPTEDDFLENPTGVDLVKRATDLFEAPTEDDLQLVEDELVDELAGRTQNELATEDSICHIACTGFCANKDATECVILKEADEYVFIQQSCPFSCTGPCSQGNVAAEDEHDEAESRESDREETVPMEIIHQRSGEIAESMTPLCSSECFDEDLERGFQVIRASPYKVASDEQSSKEVVAGERRQSSVQSVRRFSSESIDSVGQKRSVRSAEKLPDGQLHRSNEFTDLQRATDEMPIRSPEIASSQELAEETSEQSVQEMAPSLQSMGEEENDLVPVKESVSSASLKLGASEEEHVPSESTTSIKETFRESSLKSAQSHDVDGPFRVLPPPEIEGGLFHLDYVKLKKHLREGDPEVNRKILQALRWRLTSSKPETRNNIMAGYTRNDVLGLREKNRSVAEEILCPAKGAMPKEGMARFINAMASLTLGREYLCQKEHFLVRALIPLLLLEEAPLNDATRCHLLVTLQKLSLRNKMRKIMISAGLPEYVVSYLLAKHKRISQYCLEYTTALFMNLCLHEEARDQLKLTSGKVIDLIVALLDSDHDECLPYMNGAMYSVFIEPAIRIEAVNRKLDEKIEEKMRGKSENLRRQMEIIRNILSLDPSENYCTECDCLDQDEEVDHLEAEVDAGDEISDPKGEAVLEQFRKAREHCRVLDSDCLRRPATPAFHEACRSCRLSANLEEQIEEEEPRPRRKSSAHKKPRRTKPPSKTVDTLYKSEQQESKTDAELEYLLAAKAALSAKQTKPSRRTSPRRVAASKKSKDRSHLNVAELNSIHFQQRHFRKDLDPPSSYTRPVINAQGKSSFRADQAKACSLPRPYVLYKNYKVCYRSDLPSPHFTSCTSQPCHHGHQVQNRYKCDCYEEMKELIDQLGSEDQCCQRTKPNLINLEPETVRPSYNELLHSLRKNLRVTDYCTSESNRKVDCECYNFVFQSRPKVTRTP